MKVSSRTINGMVVFKSFVVVKKKDNYFGVYEKACNSQPMGNEITHGETLHAACKKAKLLQIGYDFGSKDAYDSYIGW